MAGRSAITVAVALPSRRSTSSLTTARRRAGEVVGGHRRFGRRLPLERDAGVRAPAREIRAEPVGPSQPQVRPVRGDRREDVDEVDVARVRRLPQHVAPAPGHPLRLDRRLPLLVEDQVPHVEQVVVRRVRIGEAVLERRRERPRRPDETDAVGPLVQEHDVDRHLTDDVRRPPVGTHPRVEPALPTLLRDVDQGGDVGAVGRVGDRLLPDPFGSLRGPRGAFDVAGCEERERRRPRATAIATGRSRRDGTEGAAPARSDRG